MEVDSQMQADSHSARPKVWVGRIEATWVGQPLWVPVFNGFQCAAPRRSRMPFDTNGGPRADYQRPAVVAGKLRDYQVLLTASRRARNIGQEARASYCMGVIHDESGNLSAAVECYRTFMVLSRQLADQDSEALACNAIGVALHHMAMRKGASVDLMDRAIKYHAHHLSLCAEGGEL